MMVWAFNWTKDAAMRNRVHDSLVEGKSRFGWSWRDEHNLRLENTWTKEHSRNSFLLKIKRDDWVVHVNAPEWGLCTAAKVIAEYEFDAGLPKDDGDNDFRHYFKVNRGTVIQFNRKDDRVLPSVNLYPRSRYHRVYNVRGFIESIGNLRGEKIPLSDDESRNEHYVTSYAEPYLSKLSKIVQEMNRGKDLEKYVADVLRRVPQVANVKQNGSGWGTDHGADLIVTLRSLAGLPLEPTVVVQVKSYVGDHNDIGAVEQLKHAIAHFEADAGMLVTTGGLTDRLQRALDAANEPSDAPPIHVLAGDELVRFIIKHASGHLFRL